MKTNLFRHFKSLAIIAIGLILSTTTLALTPVDPGQKRIQVRDSQTRVGLEVQIEPVKRRFAVGEPIRFELLANQPAYVYLYNIDLGTGDATVLLPNRHQSDNRLPSHQRTEVPNQRLEFVSDRPGTERVVMIASREPLDLDRSRFGDAGGFYTTKAAELEQGFAAKGIRVRETPGRDVSDELVIQILDLEVDLPEPNLAPAPAPDAVTTFVNSDQNVYRDGDSVKLLFGADQPGWVHLYLLDPTGTTKLIGRTRVDGETIAHLAATAEPPLGMYRIGAFYSPTRDLPMDADPGGKLIRLTGKGGAGEGFAVHTIHIWQ